MDANAAVAEAKSLAGRSRARAKADGELAAALADADLLSAGSLPRLEAAPAEGPLGQFRKRWRPWTQARALVEEFLAIGLADGAKGDSPGFAARNLGQSPSRAEGDSPSFAARNLGQSPSRFPAAVRSDAASLTASYNQLEQLKAKIAAAQIAGSGPLSDLVDRRIAELAARIAKRQQEDEAAALAAQARTAFEQGQIDQALTLCGQWLTRYGGAVDAASVEAVQSLRRRAEFQREREQASARLKAAATPADREVVLAGFLQKFPDRESRPEAELLVLRSCERQLEKLRARAAAEARVQAARAAVEQLDGAPPEEFDARVARAAGIFRQYPEPQVKALVGERVRRWLSEGLPQKQLREPPLLQEAETKSWGLLRGYFRKVEGADGRAGYQYYEAYKDFLKPAAEADTQPAGEFLRPPGPSVLRAAVDQYHAARQRLLEHPQRRRGWVEFEALCETLQRQLDEYRRKPGAAREEVRFDREAGFVRKLVSGPGWREWEKAWEGEARE